MFRPRGCHFPLCTLCPMYSRDPDRALSRQACSKFQHDGGLPNLRSILGISESPITTLSDPRGHHAFTRALLLAGLELPCDAGRLQCRSSTKRGKRRGGSASGPEVDAGLLFVGGESAAGPPPALVDVCRARHGPLFGSIYHGLLLVIAEKSSLEKKTYSILILLPQKHLILHDLYIYIIYIYIYIYNMI